MNKKKRTPKPQPREAPMRDIRRTEKTGEISTHGTYKDGIETNVQEESGIRTGRNTKKNVMPMS